MSVKVSRTRLAAVIAERSLKNVNSEALSREIAAYLLSEGRGSELDSILRDILQYRADHGVVEATALTAHPLSDKDRRDVEQVVRELYPKADQIIISEECDVSIIGGIKVVLANQQLDLSVRRQLNRFRQLTAIPGGAYIHE